MRTSSSLCWRPLSHDLPRVHKPSTNHARSPFRVVEQTTGREIDWINRFLDRECVRRLADTTLRSYAHDLLHFLRWWESVHHTEPLPKTRSPNRLCWTMCDSSPANNPTCRRHHQPPRRHRRSRLAQRVPGRSPPVAPAFSTPIGGARRWASAGRARAEPLAREEAQTNHRAAVGR